LCLSNAVTVAYSLQKLLPGRAAQRSITETLRRNAPIITANLGNLCSDLEHFKLPAAVGDLTTDAFVFFHDLLSSKILVASFLAHSFHDKLAQRQAPEIEDLQKVTALLDAVIDAIVHGFERSP
jgi:hypothetical protein